jgi:hypothetical protein
MQPRLASNSPSSCLSLLSAGITDVPYHAWLCCVHFKLSHLLNTQDCPLHRQENRGSRLVLSLCELGEEVKNCYGQLGLVLLVEN